jgi:hypothetical protein
VLAQVEEDLDRAACLISDGDIATILPSKAHGNCGSFASFILLLGFWHFLCTSLFCEVLFF